MTNQDGRKTDGTQGFRELSDDDVEYSICFSFAALMKFCKCPAVSHN
jgi:hypothetical protein